MYKAFHYYIITRKNYVSIRRIIWQTVRMSRMSSCHRGLRWCPKPIPILTHRHPDQKMSTRQPIQYRHNARASMEILERHQDWSVTKPEQHLQCLNCWVLNVCSCDLVGFGIDVRLYVGVRSSSLGSTDFGFFLSSKKPNGFLAIWNHHTCLS